MREQARRNNAVATNRAGRNRDIHNESPPGIRRNQVISIQCGEGPLTTPSVTFGQERRNGRFDVTAAKGSPTPRFPSSEHPQPHLLTPFNAGLDRPTVRQRFDLVCRMRRLSPEHRFSRPCHISYRGLKLPRVSGLLGRFTCGAGPICRRWTVL